MIKPIYENPIATIILKVKEGNMSHGGEEQDSGAYFITAIQHGTESSNQSNLATKLDRNR